MENEIVRFPHEGFTGRRKIKTNVREVTKENVWEVIGKALPLHRKNMCEIKYLWEYYCGRQDIRFKEKYVRESINNKIVANHANEIVVFKTSYLLSEPVQYISHDGKKVGDITRLNDILRKCDKESLDKEIVTWMHICGIGERFVPPGSPLMVYTLDPREAFVIYSSRIGNKPMAGVIIQTDDHDNEFYTVYTEKKCFTVYPDRVEDEGHILGGIPLIEYENNTERMGAFETVISLLNAINDMESDAQDSVEDFVNGFDVFQNCEIGGDDYKNLSLGGQAVMVKSSNAGEEAKVYRVTSELSQEGVQKRIDDYTEKYLSICGMPNRNGGTSTSDTGTAVIFRDGWSEAESRAKDSEKLFNRSERKFLEIVLTILDTKKGYKLGLDVEDIDVNFARRALANVQSRFQCLCEALANDYIDPMDAYNAFGDIFGDKTAAYQRGLAWHEVLRLEAEQDIKRDLGRDEAV
jgi:SPP1 family phage portal protein